MTYCTIVRPACPYDCMDPFNYMEIWKAQIYKNFLSVHTIVQTVRNPYNCRIRTVQTVPCPKNLCLQKNLPRCLFPDLPISDCSGKITLAATSFFLWKVKHLSTWENFSLKTSYLRFSQSQNLSIFQDLSLASLENNPFLKSKSTLDLKNVSKPLLKSPFIILQWPNTMCIKTICHKQWSQYHDLLDLLSDLDHLRSTATI